MIDNTKLGAVLAWKFPAEFDALAYMVVQGEDDVQTIHLWDAEKMGRGTPSERPGIQSSQKKSLPRTSRSG